MNEEAITVVIINKIKLGNERALLVLYKKYHMPLFQFINRQIRDVGIAEELVQDVFLGCIEGIREGREILSFSAYIYMIARYKTIDHIRRKKIKKILLSALPENIINGCAALLFNEKVQKDEIADRAVETMCDWAVRTSSTREATFSELKALTTLDTPVRNAQVSLLRNAQVFLETVALLQL